MKRASELPPAGYASNGCRRVYARIAEVRRAFGLAFYETAELVSMVRVFRRGAAGAGLGCGAIRLLIRLLRCGHERPV